MTPYAWVTEFTTCAVCWCPLAPDEETVVVIPLGPASDGCVCSLCWEFIAPPRRENATAIAKRRLRGGAGIWGEAS